MSFIVLKKGSIIAILVTILVITVGTIWSLSSKNSYPTVSLSEKNGEKQVIQLVTGEFKSQTADGKELEAYRWDPGTIVVEKGKEVELRIFGVNGTEHPFYIEGTDVTGTVRKGKETVINVTFSKEGTYRLICETHETIQNNGPMIAYIVVD
ncbi:cupredoxin domain-containing protein [Rossellomorea sp. YZS02]|uniref:cupredoxin domain-containing protein n=1 Tax=Rossellomorea sp. YZS02 TaxID=3097358 RepID=UPI002A0F253F|nr:cupredoxin domain-containing protein [Rossellomorea sp. YZS02]MDX8346322.1 cupredoxin domain-containing protein [Rossellomorea sp. YZS02]